MGFTKKGTAMETIGRVEDLGFRIWGVRVGV